MSTTTAIRVPAGWYPDPVESASNGMTTKRRWWDGAAWTHHTAPLQTPVSPSVSAEALAAATASAQASYSVVGFAPETVSPRESARAAETMSLHVVHPGAGRHSAASTVSPANAETAGYEPFSSRDLADAVEAPSITNAAAYAMNLRVHTVSVWLMAVMPVMQVSLAFWAFSILPAESSAWTRGLAVIFPLVLMGALAGQDARLMELSGHVRTAPWIAAALAPPLYLGLRGLHVARATGALPWPLIVWGVAQLGVLPVWSAIDPAGVAAVLQAFV